METTERIESIRHNNGAQRKRELTGKKNIGTPCRGSVESSDAYNLLSTHFNYNHARNTCHREGNSKKSHQETKMDLDDLVCHVGLEVDTGLM